MRVFYLTPDPPPLNAEAGTTEQEWITFTGQAKFNAYGVILLEGGEWAPYGSGAERVVQETTDLVPWHRVIQVEGYPA
jgi:hypothetical protein